MKKETENKLLELSRKNKEREPNRVRLANILGIVVRGAGNENIPFFRPHPGLFSLPSEDFPENKTGAATNGVCAGLSKLKLDPEIFEGFGIDSP
ncbi:MAG: hypothetical protein IH794_05380 [Acidobacteria bacterium]|nr:hypothetical protein [Acidobacteriota bacterium]